MELKCNDVSGIINFSEKSQAESTMKSAEFIQNDESYAKSTTGPANNQDDRLIKV